VGGNVQVVNTNSFAAPFAWTNSHVHSTLRKQRFTVNIEFEPLSENQLRQYIDAETVFAAWQKARDEALTVRGSMRWRELRGKSTLLRISASGEQKVIGKDNVESRELYDRFVARKIAAEARVKSLRATVAVHQRLNRALRIGRAPAVVVGILNEIERAGHAEHIKTIGTHALFAYEAACGVRIQQGAMATLDVDLFFDTRKRISFFTQMQQNDASFLEIIQRADPSFEVMPDQKQTAVNNKGFQVDIVRRLVRDGDPHPLRMSDRENDLWAVQIPKSELIESAENFDQLIVSASGEMALMRTIDPVSFVRVKRLVAAAADRDPMKRPKDIVQADIVERLITDYLPQWHSKIAARVTAP